MTLSTGVYGTVAEVLAFTTHLLDGKGGTGVLAFNTTTHPTAVQVEKFLTRASAYVDIALNTHGFTTPVTHTTAKLMLDDWVVGKATMYTELTQRGAGFNEEEGSRTSSFKSISNDAMKFVEDNALGLKRIGVPVSHAMSEGLAFTALADQDKRSDPDDSSLEQPVFTRGLFNSTNSEVESE